MRVLITGAGGQLGTDLALHCAGSGDEVVALTRRELDITDHARVVQAIADQGFDVVFNCAAWTQVDACEADVERAVLINGHAVGLVAEACEHAGSHLVQISTDYVFDGTKDGAYTEDDPTCPPSAYGKSKVVGEQAAGTASSIVRTSWLCSTHGNNMVATMLRLLREDGQLRFVNDQRGHPTFSDDLAVALRLIGAAREPGLLHVTNRGAVSWFEFAQQVAVAGGYEPTRVAAIRTADLVPARPAPRPANSVLSNDRFDGLGYVPLPHFADRLPDIISAYGR